MDASLSLSASSAAPLRCPSFLFDLATPPFSLLPLTPPDPDELYCFNQSPQQIQGASTCSKLSINRELCDTTTLGCEENDKCNSFRYLGSSSSSDSMSTNSNSLQTIPSLTSSLPSSASETSIMTADSSSLKGKASIQTSARVSMEEKEEPTMLANFSAKTSFLQRIRPKMGSNRNQSNSTHHLYSLHNVKGPSEEANLLCDVEEEKEEKDLATSIYNSEYRKQHSRFASQTVALKMMQEDCEPRMVFRNASFQGDTSNSQLSLYLQRQGDLRPETPAYQFSTVDTISSSTSTFGSLFKKLKAKSKKGSSCRVSAQTKFNMTLQAQEAKEKELETARGKLRLSWGCAARQVWNADGYMKESQGRVSCADSNGEHLLDRNDPHLKQWTGFYQAYSQGRLDLSEIPLVPNGVPIFECCPQATPASNGPLDAPAPDWELLRARTYARLELDKLSESALQIIVDKVNLCASALQIQRSMLHCLEGDTILNLTRKGLQQEKSSRQQSMCSHTILNRNRGMTVQDLNQDWRFKDLDNEEDSRLCYYSGMPIVAANGLPIAVLSIWDSKREFTVEPQFLRRTVREIGQIIEEHYREKWQEKICEMAKSVDRLQDRLHGREMSSPCGTKVEGQHYQHFLGSSAPYDMSELEALADLGLLITLEDVERLTLTVEEMASLLNMETVYVAAVHLPDSTRSKERICLIASHNLAATSKLSARYHQELFTSDLIADNVDFSKTFCLSQNNCQTSTTNVNQRRLQPLKGSEECDAVLAVPIAKRGKVGIVIGALTKNKKKIIGVEDLRYIQALQSTLCSVIDRYQEMPSLLLPLVTDEQQQQEIIINRRSKSSISSTYSCSSLTSSVNSRIGLYKKSKSCSSLQGNSSPSKSMSQKSSLQDSSCPFDYGLSPRPRAKRAKSISEKTRQEKVSTPSEVDTKEWLAF